VKDVIGPMLHYNKNLKKHSQNLRRNMTDAERNIWFRVRNGQLKGKQFYRQKIIGEYIVDFFCPKAKLVLEIDGGQHYSEEGQATDKIRDDYLRGLGLKIIRFSDRDIFENSNGVIEKIFENL
jgi:very-short-patch-repair endonuclease